MSPLALITLRLVFFKDSLVPKRPAYIHELRIVYRQDGYCHTSDLCSRLQLGSLPFKMLGPYVAAGMEKADNLVGVRVDTGHVRAFETIAVDAAAEQDFQAQFCPRAVSQ